MFLFENQYGRYTFVYGIISYLIRLTLYNVWKTKKKIEFIYPKSSLVHDRDVKKLHCMYSDMSFTTLFTLDDNDDNNTF